MYVSPGAGTNIVREFETQTQCTTMRGAIVAAAAPDLRKTIHLTCLPDQTKPADKADKPDKPDKPDK
jgi:hypothetical protein